MPFIKAFDFEPYRDKKQFLHFSDGFVGYGDEYWMNFVGITDSYIPKIELPMTILYDDTYIWPNERLYQYLIKTYLSTKEFGNERVEHGGLSLCF